MAKKLCMIFLWLMTVSYVRSQEFSFPKINADDSIALATQMPLLAGKVLLQYKNDTDQKKYLANLFKLQMLGGKIDDGNLSMKNLRNLLKEDDPQFYRLLYIQYQLYEEAKLLQAVSGLSFEDAFSKALTKFFTALDDKTANRISSAFISRNGISELQNNFKTSLINYQKKDTPTIADAISLCNDYYILKVYSSIEQLSKNLITEDNNRRYLIQEVLIKTRDNALISAVVVRKKNAKKPEPVILQFSIYARQPGYSGAIESAANGYVGVSAYTRGKRYSPDEVVAYEHDGKDVYDVIDWISKQKWCNGKVGMYGGSYLGFTQWAATKKIHPALKTIVPSAAAAPGLDVPMTNNVFMNFVFPWIYYVSNNKFLDEADYNDNEKWDALYNKWYKEGTPYGSLDSLSGRGINKMFQSWIAHPSYDKYWQSMIPYKKEFSKINIPVLTTTGYYDGGQIGAMYYYREHLKYNSKANHYLIIGPYGHFGSQGYPEAVYRGYKIDHAANISIHNIIYQWFDYILKGGSKPSFLKDKVNFEVMGANEWKHVPSLKKMNNSDLKFFLSNDAESNHFKLSSKQPCKINFIKQTVDFKDRDQQNNYYFANNIIRDSLTLDNGISFLTEPLKKSIMISGAFSGQLKASINKKDMDYSINLFEITPDGKYFFLSYFMGRASYAKNPSARHVLTSGKIETIPFTNSYITCKKINKGSRILVVLNINKSPNEQINYGTGKNVSDETINDAQIPLQIKWYSNSYIKIPIWK